MTDPSICSFGLSSNSLASNSIANAPSSYSIFSFFLHSELFDILSSFESDTINSLVLSCFEDSPSDYSAFSVAIIFKDKPRPKPYFEWELGNRSPSSLPAIFKLFHSSVSVNSEGFFLFIEFWVDFYSDRSLKLYSSCSWSCFVPAVIASRIYLQKLFLRTRIFSGEIF